MELSIIIVSWNVKDRLRDNLRSIFYSSISKSNFEVFVVDNNSSDGTVELVRREFPEVILIENKDNLGFAKANNQALKQARGDYFLLLNPDMKVFPDTLDKMLGWMKTNQQVSVAGCHLIDELGEIVKHVRRFPTFIDQLAIVLKMPHLFPTVLSNYLRNDFDYSVAAKVDSVRGGFFMLRKETLEKIGLLDERFFVWFEEVDYCRRVSQAGGEVWYTPTVKCIDYVGQSFNQVKRGTTQKYFRNSMLLYFKKWHPFWQYLILRLAWPISKLMVWSGELIKFKRVAKT